MPTPKFRNPSEDIAGFDRLTDAQILALTIWGEARGSSLNAQLAVGEVIMNRVDDGRYGKGVRGVCLKRQAFSCWWEVSPNRERVIVMAIAVLGGRPFPTLAAKRGYLQINALVPGIHGRVVRPVGAGAPCTTIVFLTTSRRCGPWWAKGRVPDFTLEAFKFYVGIDDAPKRRSR
jgi:hypothetical protein